jgi:5-methylcytosine-specific restriction endonuclease McrA
MKRERPLSKRSRLKPVGKRGRAIRREIESVRAVVLARDGNRCRRCGSSRKPLDLHHRRGRAQGGANTAENLISLCRACHSSITAQTAPDWRKWVEMRKAGAA